MSSISIIGMGGMARAIGARAVEGGNAVEGHRRTRAKAEDLAARSAAPRGTFGTAPAGDIVILALPYASACRRRPVRGTRWPARSSSTSPTPFNPDAAGLVTPAGTPRSGDRQGRPGGRARREGVQHRLTATSWTRPPLVVLLAGDDAQAKASVSAYREHRAAPAGHRRPGAGELAGRSGPDVDGPPARGRGQTIDLGVTSLA